jgi:serine protease AprX
MTNARLSRESVSPASRGISTAPLWPGCEPTVVADRPAVYFGDRDGNKIADDLDDRFVSLAAGKASEVVVRAVVSLNEPASDVLLASLAREAGGFKPTARWRYALNGFAADLSLAQIARLAGHPAVHRVNPDRPVRLHLSGATSWMGVRQAWCDWGLSGDLDGTPSSYSTSDMVIAVVDTGIDTGHQDLADGKVVGWYDAINGSPAPYDDHGHGTWTSSIAAGAGVADSDYTGVAYGAALVGVKVLDASGSGTQAQVLSGLDWMILHRNTYNIRVGNCSFGASGSSDGQDPVSLAVNQAVDAGIVMVVSAGNDGPTQYTIGSPAAAVKAITVGAIRDPARLGWALASFSSRGPTADGRTKPNLVAPGVSLTAAQAGTEDGYVTHSGTSASAPLIAGVAALILSANGNLSPSQVRRTLFGTLSIRDYGRLGLDNDWGRGLSLPYEAIKWAGAYRTNGFSDGLKTLYRYGRATNPAAVDWGFDVTDIAAPVAVTLVVENWTLTRNFDISLLDPAGHVVATSAGVLRQKAIAYEPIVAGTYKVRVTPRDDSTGSYWLNVSYR